MPRYIDADWLLDRAVPMGWSSPKWVSDIVINYAPTIDEEEIAAEYCMKRCLVMITMDTYEKLIAYYNRGNDYTAVLSGLNRGESEKI